MAPRQVPISCSRRPAVGFRTAPSWGPRVPWRSASGTLRDGCGRPVPGEASLVQAHSGVGPHGPPRPGQTSPCGKGIDHRLYGQPPAGRTEETRSADNRRRSCAACPTARSSRPEPSHRYEADPMTMTALDSPLLRMTQETPTQYWNDSCAVDELDYAVERGATGRDLESEHRARRDEEGEGPLGAARPRARRAPTRRWTEVELTWAIVEEMAARGAAILQPGLRSAARRPRRAGSRSRPTRPTTATRPGWSSRPSASHGLAPNIQVKFPVTAAGLVAIEEATFRGVNINGTVSFTVPQAHRRRRGRRARPRPARRGRRRRRLDVADRHDHDRAARRLDEGPRRARRPGRPPGRPELGRASPPSSAPTGSSASAATGRACWPRPTGTGSTGPSWSAATSA